MRQERSDQTLQPTALIHEAYFKLSPRNADCQNRFLGVAAQAMRHILVDHALEVNAAKRVSPHWKPLDEALDYSDEKSRALLAINEALTRLAELDQRQSKVVELRFVGGCPEQETAEILGISVRTVKRDWRVARAWLYAELSNR